MLNDDAQFERYLKQFRPILAERLALSRRTVRPRFRFWWAWAFAGCTLLIAIVISLSFQREGPRQPVFSRQQAPDRSPLTIRRANAAVFPAPATGSALDQMAFPSESQFPNGERSALAILGQEKTKL